MSENGHGCDELVVRPAGAAWGGLLHRNDSERARRFRRELGLPGERALIMTGHQAEFWHPGILAKYLAVDAGARRLGADAAWITVDQDVRASVGVRYPARDAEGQLVVRSEEYTAGGGRALVASPHDRVEPFVAAGLRRIEEAMAGERGELARRVAGALKALMKPLLGEAREVASIFATELARTSLFREMVERMRREPERVCAAYNAAAARHPAAGIRPLLANDVQEMYELPLWHITGGERRRVYAEMLDGLRREELAPRALLMTALLRMAGCDLFVHGTGGGGEGEGDGYDRVMEEWLAEWLGVGSEDLAPIAVVTATCRLPLEAEALPGGEEVGRAVWLAHHARHDPGVFGDLAPAEEKRKLAAAIAAAERGGAERAELFDRMQGMLEAYREERRGELAGLMERAERARRRAAEEGILMDRKWAFALYPEEVLERLRQRVESSFMQESARNGRR